MPFSQVLAPEHVLLDLAVASKQGVLEVLSARAAALSDVDVDANTIFAALTAREQLGSTGMGQGIAIPHATIAALASPIGLLAQLARPIAFDAVDDAPVDIICVLLIPAADRSVGLKLLSTAARMLRSQDMRKLIRGARQPNALHAAIAEAYGDQLSG